MSQIELQSSLWHVGLKFVMKSILFLGEGCRASLSTVIELVFIPDN